MNTKHFSLQDLQKIGIISLDVYLIGVHFILCSSMNMATKATLKNEPKGVTCHEAKKSKDLYKSKDHS